jgi:lysophospholipase L1-like esterase
MMKSKRVLILSLAINIAFLAATAFFVYRRGMIASLFNKGAPAHSNEAGKYIDSAYYKTRRSIFNQLPEHRGAIIFVGDSITDNAEWAELFQRDDILNRGINSELLEGVRQRRGELLRHHPRKLFIMIGINDFMVADKTPEEVIESYRLLLQALRAEAPETQLIIQSILPVNKMVYAKNPPGMVDEAHKKLDDKIVLVNNALSRMADGRQTLYVDLYSEMVDAQHQLDSRYTYDGLHLNGDGYVKWRDVIGALVK